MRLTSNTKLKQREEFLMKNWLNISNKHKGFQGLKALEPFLIFIIIFFCDFPNYLAWISSRKHICWNTLCNNASRCNHRIISYTNASYNLRASANPNIIPNFDWPSILQALSYSEYYLSHLFKEKMNITLKDYLMHKKIPKNTRI